MARRPSGSVRDRRLADGRIAFDVRIRDQQVTVGYSPGCSRREAQALLDTTLLPAALLGEAWWERVAPPPAAVTPSSLLVADLLRDYLATIDSRYEKATTRNAYRSPVEVHVGPFFAHDGDRLRTADELTGPLVSEFVEANRAEREVLCDLADTLAELDDATLRDPALLRRQLDEAEWRMLMQYGKRGQKHRAGDSGGAGRFSISTRGLSNNEINRCLNRLAEAIRLAEEDNALVLKDPTRRRRLPHEKPDRTWLMPDALEAIFDAALELDTKRPSGTSGGLPLGRYPVVVCLGLSGPRVSELCAFGASDLRSDGLDVLGSKTSAGKRLIEVHDFVDEPDAGMPCGPEGQPLLAFWVRWTHRPKIEAGPIGCRPSASAVLRSADTPKERIGFAACRRRPLGLRSSSCRPPLSIVCACAADAGGFSDSSPLVAWL